MQSQFPQFIKENFVHSCEIHLTRKHRSSLVLLKNLQLYEVNKKHILNSIDLQNTVISNVRQKIELYTWETQNYGNETLSNTIRSQSRIDTDLMFGKFIYQFGRYEKVVYILLKCWNYLVVIRKDTKGFTLQAEYINVQSFRLFKEYDYQARLVIIFTNGSQDITDFQGNNSQSLAASKDDGYKKIFDRVKMKQSELSVHKTITRTEFKRLKSSDLFGCNFLRSPRFDEMQILSKCADTWYKITADDNIVVGVPLVNNSSTSRTVLQNFKAVLCGGTSINYEFVLYQLSKKLCNIESLQSFFYSQNEVNYEKINWSRCIDLILRPEGFYILILKLNAHDVHTHDDVGYPLFACFDIIVSDKTFHHKSFVTSLSFQDIFTNSIYRLSFGQNHLHRDMLSVIATSFKKNAQIEWITDFTTFEKYVCNELGFFRISLDQHEIEPMQLDEQEDEHDNEQNNNFFFNRQLESLWYGTLISLSHTCAKNYSAMVLYTKTQAKSAIFYRLLATELKIKCAIKEVICNTTNLRTKLIKIEAALRDECETRIKMLSIKRNNQGLAEKQEVQKQLHFNEFKTDVEWRDLAT